MRWQILVISVILNFIGISSLHAIPATVEPSFAISPTPLRGCSGQCYTHRPSNLIWKSKQPGLVLRRTLGRHLPHGCRC
ncbi:hypothetical protein CC80DRAFT_143866 [Byssothecium circinans]|uniref:DAN domain-containing protein n=1 Tax=Byssothecium circinans TaxID=147558 RepID=A0A6A5TMN6_9PLEO|nr:hypothetical protein CC80DRAFT_143866 [Byssothecium circinans]